MLTYKLNGNNMAELNPGEATVTRARKQIYKDGSWKIKTIYGTIQIPCKVEYSTKEDLVSKLNSIDVYLKSGVLYIDNHKYDVKLLLALKPDLNFSDFTVIFQTDEFEYEVYSYIATTAVQASSYNPLQAYNCYSAMSNPNAIIAEVEIDASSINIITCDFICLDKIVYSPTIPDEYVLNADNKIERRYDASI